MNFWTKSSEVHLSYHVALTGFALALGPWQPEPPPFSDLGKSVTKWSPWKILSARQWVWMPSTLKGFFRDQQCVVHLGHWIPHPPLFLNSQVWGQQYWEAEGEHRREVPYLSFSPSPSPLSSSRSLPCLTTLPCAWPWVHSSSQTRCGFWYLGEQTLYNILSLFSDSITVALGVAEVRFHLFGGYGMWLPSWLRSEGFWGILVLTSNNYGWHFWSTSLRQALC